MSNHLLTVTPPSPPLDDGLREIPWDTAAFGRRCFELAGLPSDAAMLRSLLLRRDAQTCTWRGIHTGPVLPEALRHAGFISAELQLSFSLGLDPTLPADPALRPFEPADAADCHDLLGRAFRRTRFHAIPGLDPNRIAKRYTAWFDQLYATHPQLILAYHDGAGVAGVFAAQPQPRGLYLALAAAETGLGWRLFRAALGAYARMGHRRGHAAVDAANASVVTLYGRFGASFTAATDIAMWNAEARW